jgi:hypothetical protein
LHKATVSLTDFGWSTVADEAERQGVSIEELLAHAAMYYLADLDSGRLGARVPDAGARDDAGEVFR